jgi:hypothetical protein
MAWGIPILSCYHWDYLEFCYTSVQGYLMNQAVRWWCKYIFTDVRGRRYSLHTCLYFCSSSALLICSSLPVYSTITTGIKLIVLLFQRLFMLTLIFNSSLLANYSTFYASLQLLLHGFIVYWFLLMDFPSLNLHGWHYKKMSSLWKLKLFRGQTLVQGYVVHNCFWFFLHLA